MFVCLFVSLTIIIIWQKYQYSRVSYTGWPVTSKPHITVAPSTGIWGTIIWDLSPIPVSHIPVPHITDILTGLWDQVSYNGPVYETGIIYQSKWLLYDAGMICWLLDCRLSIVDFSIVDFSIVDFSYCWLHIVDF